MSQLPYFRTTALHAHTGALVVVDLAVDAWQALTQDLEPTTALMVLNPHADGLLQLAAHLGDLQAPLHSIHLIGHGRPGSMRLGSTALDLASLQTCASHWQQVGHALGEGGALVLYGCQVAQGQAGRQFIDALAACTGAEVTASSRPVGARALGGDWVFDHCTGKVAAAPVLHPAAMAQFAGVLDAGALGEAGVQSILDEFGDIDRFLNRFLTVADTIPGFSKLVEDATDGLRQTIDATGADVNQDDETGDFHIAFDLGSAGTLTFIVGSNILSQLSVGSTDFLLAINYAPDPGQFENLFDNTPFDGLAPTSTELVVSTGEVTSVGNVALDSGVSLVASFDIADSDNGFFQFLNGYLGIDQVSAFVNVDRSHQSFNGNIALDYTVGVGDFSLTYNDIGFEIGFQNGVPEFTADATVTLEGYDPTQTTKPLVLNSGFKIDPTALSLFMQADIAEGWENPFGIQDVTVTTFGVQIGASYAPPWVDNVGFVLDFVNGNVDAKLLMAIDFNTPTHNAFQLTINESVSIAEVFLKAMPSTAVVGAVTHLIGLGEEFDKVFDIIPVKVMSWDADGDGELDPLLSVVPFETQIAATTLEAGLSLSAEVDVFGAIGRLNLEAGTDWSSMSGSLVIEELDIANHLVVIGGERPGTDLTAAFSIGTGGVSISGNARLEVLGYSLARADFAISDTLVHVGKTYFDVYLAKAEINSLDINLLTGKASGEGGLSVAGYKVAGVKFDIAKDHVSFASSIDFGGVASLNGNFKVNSAGLTAQGSAKLGNTDVSEAKLTVDNSGKVVIESDTGFSIAGVNGSVSTHLKATLDHGRTGLDVSFSAGLLGTIGFSMALNGNVAEEVAKRVTGDLGGQAAWVVDAVAAGATDLLSAGNFSYAAAQIDHAVNSAIGEVSQVFDGLFGKSRERNQTILGDDRDQNQNVPFNPFQPNPLRVLEGNGGNDIIFGFGGRDVLIGHQGNDAMDGGSGNDYLYGGSGNDVLNGADGNDNVNGDAGDDEVFGGLGNDTVHGDGEAGDGDGHDRVHGGAGEDQVFGDGGNDQLWGDGGNDALYGGVGNDVLYGGNDNDVLYGGDGTNTLSGGDGNDLLYGGSGNDVLLGGAGNDVLDGGSGPNVLDGGSGDDTYYVNSGLDEVIEGETGSGIDTVVSPFAFTLSDSDGSSLRNLTLVGTYASPGTGNRWDNRILGNGASNVLKGEGGNDYLDGQGGADTLNGGAGNDTYVVDNFGDQVIESADNGTDTVISAVDFRLERTALENLTLTDSSSVGGFPARRGSGNELDNAIVGNKGVNSLYGLGGNDLLDGGAGADEMEGGSGNDTYIVDNAGDVVTETSSASNEIDTVQSVITYTLGTNLERLVLTGTAAINGTGNALANTLTGNDAANTLDGGAGNDTLDGGLGADILIGGTGNDLYVVDNSGDTVIEADTPAGGYDIVRTSVSFTMSAGVEELQLTGDAAISGYGNALGNQMYGNAADNLLDGGAGADLMRGNGGNDSYTVDNAGDWIEEAAEAGNDTVRSSVSRTLEANIENLELTGAAAIDGAGNALANRITGNDRANTLDGGAGSDDLRGGAGNDVYIVDNVGDRVVESHNAGTDTVRTSVSRTLEANVENLVITGTAAVRVVANALGNHIIGNGNDNHIEAGAGNDVVEGGDGNDQLFGEIGDDTLNGGAGNDYLVGHDGNDTLLGGDGEDSLHGNAGLDRMEGGAGNDYLNGYEGDDALFGGDGNDALIGDMGNDLLDGGAGSDDLRGGAGDDTYIVDNVGDQVIESADNGTDTVISAVDFRLERTALENLTLTDSSSVGGFSARRGSGNELDNVIAGNKGVNSLYGLGGNDLLDGGAGADEMEGGSGNDTYIVDNAGDVVTETFTLPTEVDTVRSSVSYTLGANLENLLLTGTAAVDGTGNALANSITGNVAANTLDGGAGADTLIGGGGDDTYIIDNAVDTVTEAANAGTDTVRSSVGRTLEANVENLELTGPAAIDGAGNELANTLTGNAAANRLDGGAGADRLIGGGGNDTYVVDHVGDVVTETSSLATEIDTIRSSVSYTLGENVENLVLTGAAEVDGTGNALANVLTGNDRNNTLLAGAGDDVVIADLGDDLVHGGDGNDVLDGQNGNDVLFGDGGNDTLYAGGGNDMLDGGSGVDDMYGAAGDDTFVVDDAGDFVNESADDGYDTVRGSISYNLGANLENLVLTGLAAINGTGNALANTLTGNDADNTLDGGAGVDTLVGGAGNDTYVVDNLGDVVIETSTVATEIDTVRSAASFTLGDNLEYLVLTGTAAIDGSGNDLANRILGNAGVNILNGGAGDDWLLGLGGRDTLLGGSGDDLYSVYDSNTVVVEDAGASAGHDTVLATVQYTLAANVEDLLLFEGGGDSAFIRDFEGTGNVLSNRITGNSGNNTLDGGAGADTLTGGAGDDTYIVDNAGDVVTETSTLATEIDTVRSSVSFSLGANLENLVLTGSAAIDGNGTALDNMLVGNDAANVLDGQNGNDTVRGGGGNDWLYGGGGNDWLDGGSGADEMRGSYGDDTFVVDDGGDSVFESAGDGNDTVRSAISYMLGDNLENLVLTGTTAIDGTGNALANVLTGNDAANTLDGAAGADTLIGGTGDDIYIVDSSDLIVEDANAGTDTVRSSLGRLLEANVENLELTGTQAINGMGNGLANRMTGNGANNKLDGQGGADTLVGGGGDDSYTVDDAGDRIVEDANAGIDIVRSSVGRTLEANVENLELAGTAAINGTGNALANFIAGSSANNVLDGGAGADTLAGNGGDDLYIVDNAGDRVIESANGGADTVRSSVGRTLEANVENLELAGTAAINGTGNALANRLTGNAAANTLDGGAGADTLAGNGGDDLYIVDIVSDRVIEDADAGTDTVRSSVGRTLEANVENLELTGTAAINGTGNGVANVLTGNGAANTLNGGGGADTLIGGAGADRLTGGTGADHFSGSAAQLHQDRITDLGLDDAIDLIDTRFAALRYDSQTGVLSMDTGNNGGFATRIQLSTGLVGEFLVTPGAAGTDASTQVRLMVDSDGDGVGDFRDNARFVPNADQRDTDGDGFGNIVDADLDQDNFVDFFDLSILESVLFTADANADFNGDGEVDFFDLSIMESLLFAAPGPGATGLLASPLFDPPAATASDMPDVTLHLIGIANTDQAMVAWQ